jgi:hypothetical protein
MLLLLLLLLAVVLLLLLLLRLQTGALCPTSIALLVMFCKRYSDTASRLNAQGFATDLAGTQQHVQMPGRVCSSRIAGLLCTMHVIRLSRTEEPLLAFDSNRRSMVYCVISWWLLAG